MAKLGAAVANMAKGKKVTRKAWKVGNHLKMVSDTIVRVRPNGNETNASLKSEDILADDYSVVK